MIYVYGNLVMGRPQQALIAANCSQIVYLFSCIYYCVMVLSQILTRILLFLRHDQCYKVCLLYCDNIITLYCAIFHKQLQDRQTKPCMVCYVHL